MIAKGPQGRVRYTHQNTVALINYSLYQILMTTPGERMWNPEFGCKLRELIFKNVSDTTFTTAKNIILTAIRRWEPRVTVEPADITVTVTAATLSSEAVVNVKVDYTINNPDYTTQDGQSVTITL